MLNKLVDKEQSLENNEAFNCHNLPAKIGFYTYDEKLLYENKYPFNTPIKQIIKDFINKQSLDISKNSLNKDNLAFYLKNSQIFEQLEVDTKFILYYLTKIKDTTLMIMEANKAISEGSGPNSIQSIKSTY